MEKKYVSHNSFLENIFSVKNDDMRKIITIFGIKFKIKSKKNITKKTNILFNFNLNKILKISDNKTLIIYFDHSLGGGTETYFFNQLDQLYENEILVRIQYFLDKLYYKATVYMKNEIFEIELVNFVMLSEFINKLICQKIILNNIVGYPNVKDILDLISDYKKKYTSIHVVLKGHDFYSICPEWNLLNYKGEYCNVEYDEIECKKCFEKFQIKCNDIKDKFSIFAWRKMWGKFLVNTVDELEVFSPSSKEIFSKAYPNIVNKINVNPHKIKPFPKYNICVLGAFCYCKGSKVIDNLIKYLEKNKIYSYNFHIIGEFYNSIKSDLCTFHGKYNRNNLPNILKNNNIDLILIPSVWPETFSYTTAEAIALGYPVTCFDMGGQAYQVKQYKRGKILSSFEPKIIEKEIREFMEQKEVTI